MKESPRAHLLIQRAVRTGALGAEDSLLGETDPVVLLTVRLD